MLVLLFVYNANMMCTLPQGWGATLTAYSYKLNNRHTRVVQLSTMVLHQYACTYAPATAGVLLSKFWQNPSAALLC